MISADCFSSPIPHQGGGVMTSELTVAIHAAVYLAHKTPSVQRRAESPTSVPIPSASARSRRLCAGQISSFPRGQRRRLPLKPPAAGHHVAPVARLNAALVEKMARGDPEMSCLVASSMAAEMDRIYRQLNEQCLQSLQRLTLWDLLQDLFESSLKKSS